LTVLQPPISVSSDIPGTLELLIPIWQDLFQKRFIAPSDNFFELGGELPEAVRLFSEIRRVAGVDLAPMLLYQAPTLESLAELIEVRSSRYQPLICLKPGSERPPVFMAHGIGGSLFELSRLTSSLHTRRAIYGMQVRGLDGGHAPFASIGEMASTYLPAVKQIQPRGPYVLVGYSLGGLVVLQMAQQLLESGERIALLALIDSYPHPRYLSASERLRLLRAESMRKSRRLLFRTTSAATRSPLYSAPPDAAFAPALKRVRSAAERALRAYRPEFYPGTLHFFQAATPTRFPANAQSVWSNLSAEMKTEIVPGDHLGMITAHAGELARSLNRHLESVE
jgi:thioesterase domain-containing protein